MEMSFFSSVEIWNNDLLGNDKMSGWKWQFVFSFLFKSRTFTRKWQNVKIRTTRKNVKFFKSRKMKKCLKKISSAEIKKMTFSRKCKISGWKCQKSKKKFESPRYDKTAFTPKCWMSRWKFKKLWQYNTPKILVNCFLTWKNYVFEVYSLFQLFATWKHTKSIEPSQRCPLGWLPELLHTRDDTW